jgi:hypothetical protein
MVCLLRVAGGGVGESAGVQPQLVLRIVCLLGVWTGVFGWRVQPQLVLRMVCLLRVAGGGAGESAGVQPQLVLRMVCLLQVCGRSWVIQRRVQPQLVLRMVCLLGGTGVFGWRVQPQLVLCMKCLLRGLPACGRFAAGLAPARAAHVCLLRGAGGRGDRRARGQPQLVLRIAGLLKGAGIWGWSAPQAAL